MKKIILCLLSVFFAMTLAAEERKSIKFEDGNNYAIVGEFDEQMLEDFTKFIMLYTGKELFMYFDSPGGSVFAMSRMVAMMKTSDIKFICVARFAASAAFHTFQSCHERYLLSDGIIMSHNAAGSYTGEFPRIESLFSAIKAIVDELDKEMAIRLKMDFGKYKEAINNNLWITTANAKQYNAIEGVMDKVTCPPELIKKEVVRTKISCSVFSGCTQSQSKYSACPLLSMPIPGSESTARKYEFSNPLMKFRTVVNLPDMK